MARARRKDPARVAAGIRAAITRRARAEGKDPARVHAGLKGWQTRQRRQEHAARVHGQKAREKTERALTPAQRARRTKEANRIERGRVKGIEDRGDVGSGSGGGGGRGVGGTIYDSLDDYYDDYEGDWDYYDVETSPDYEDS